MLPSFALNKTAQVLLLIAAAIILLMPSASEARCVDIGACEDRYLTCPCGQALTVSVKLKRCSCWYRWRHYCHWCDDVDEGQFCQQFRSCLECNASKRGACSLCPPGKYGRTCNWDCRCENGGVCDQTDGSCSCHDTFYGPYCQFRRDPECSRPPAIEHGHTTTTPSEGPRVTRVEYSCDANYVLTGSPSRACVASGQWDGSAPTCDPVCSSPPAVDHGHMTTTPPEGSQVTRVEYSCDANYVMSGSPSRTCVAPGQWDESAPTCEAGCSQPRDPEHGRVVTSPRDGEHFTRARYSCDANYLIQGAPRRRCMGPNSWEGAPPTCVPVCSQPPVIPDGHITTTLLSGQTVTRVEYTCDDDYVIEGSSVRKCVSPETWDEAAPSCVEITTISTTPSTTTTVTTPSTTPSPPSPSSTTPPSSTTSPVEDPTLAWTAARSGCACWFAPDRQDCACCNDGGCPCHAGRKDACVKCGNANDCDVYVTGINQWTFTPSGCDCYGRPGEPVCACCRLGGCQCGTSNPSTCVQCGRPLDCAVTDGGEGITPAPTTPTTTTPFIIPITSPPFVHVVKCAFPSEPNNGEVVTPREDTWMFDIGEIVSYKCHGNYYLYGDKRRRCLEDGTWTGQDPVCVEVNFCDDPGVPKNVVREVIPPSITRQGRLQRNVRNGRISRRGRIPRAHERTRPALALPHDLAVKMAEGKFPQFTFLQFSCESPYYELHGPKQRMCHQSGRWTSRQPTCVPICGKSTGSRTPFVTGGNVTDAGQWPWVAGLQRLHNHRWVLNCGGTLIGERWILTAAHCVTYPESTQKLPNDVIRITLGKYFREDGLDDEYVQFSNIEEIVVHELFDALSLDSDIALIRLNTSAHITGRVRPACVPVAEISARIAEPGKYGTVLGWGMTEAGEDAASLFSASVPVVDSTTCELAYEALDIFLPVTVNMFCAGFSEGVIDACSGDSGGPLVFPHGSGATAKWYVEGLVSWGSPHGCGEPNQYGGYTKVVMFSDWIKDNMY